MVGAVMRYQTALNRELVEANLRTSDIILLVLVAGCLFVAASYVLCALGDAPATRADSQGDMPMIRAIRRASSIVAFATLMSAIAVYAECSWVLWNDEVRLDYGAQAESRVWHTVAGTSSKLDCDKRLRKEIERITHPDNRPKHVLLKVHGDAVQVLYLRSDTPTERPARMQTFRYVCLPDTVDTRGPKGK